MKLLIIIGSLFFSFCAIAQKSSKKVMPFKNSKALIVGVKGKPTKSAVATTAKVPTKTAKGAMPKKAIAKDAKAENIKLKKESKTLASATKTKAGIANKEIIAKTAPKGKAIKPATKPIAKYAAAKNNDAANKTKTTVDTKAEKNAIAKNNASKESKKAIAKKIVANKAPIVAKKPLAVKVKKVMPTLEHSKDVAHQEHEAKFEMLYPTGFFSSEITEHFGKIKLGDVYYNNESVKLVTQLEREVECNVDTALVTDVAIDDDGLYIVSLKRKHYTIVMGNLSHVEVAVGDELIQGDFIGLVNQDAELTNRGSMELMLLKDTKILNPEKYMVRQFTPKPVSPTPTPVQVEPIATYK